MVGTANCLHLVHTRRRRESSLEMLLCRVVSSCHLNLDSKTSLSSRCNPNTDFQSESLRGRLLQSHLGVWPVLMVLIDVTQFTTLHVIQRVWIAPSTFAFILKYSISDHGATSSQSILASNSTTFANPCSVFHLQVCRQRQLVVFFRIKLCMVGDPPLPHVLQINSILESCVITRFVHSLASNASLYRVSSKTANNSFNPSELRHHPLGFFNALPGR